MTKIDTRLLLHIIKQNERIIRMTSANQQHINDLTTRVNKISEEIKALKAQNGAENLDFTALDAAVGQADDLNEDAVTPPDTTETPSGGEGVDNSGGTVV
jgi:C4-dicarboxylate-specific signal transduction histidine kinase